MAVNDVTSKKPGLVKDADATGVAGKAGSSSALTPPTKDGAGFRGVLKTTAAEDADKPESGGERTSPWDGSSEFANAQASTFSLRPIQPSTERGASIRPSGIVGRGGMELTSREKEIIDNQLRSVGDLIDACRQELGPNVDPRHFLDFAAAAEGVRCDQAMVKSFEKTLK